MNMHTPGSAPIAVRTANLAGLARLAPIPLYDRASLKHSIVHIGVGGFHRAHQALYLDRLLGQGDGDGWGICGVALLPHDKAISEVMKNQDCLYTLVERDADGDRPRIVGSISEVLFAPADPEAVIAKMTAAECRIISMTITEGGYYQSQSTGGFDHDHPDIVRDLQNPHNPQCVFGYLAEALERRMNRGVGPVTLMSCDNIQSNGDVFKRMFTAFLALRSPKLAGWVQTHCSFPNSMVDRITPATKDEHRELLRRQGIADEWPVVTEPFLQWVVEDRFVAGRPAWERAGAQMTLDVLPYEKMKLRLLNASHQALCYTGMLLGYRFVQQTMEDRAIRTIVRDMMDREVTPILSPVPGIDLDGYKSTLIERFANPGIGDQLARVGTEGSIRIPRFVLPSVLDQLAAGGPIRLLAFTVASWLRYLSGKDDAGNELPANDPLLERLRSIALKAGSDPEPFFALDTVFGPELPRNRRFVDEVGTALACFYQKGSRAAIEMYAGFGG